jgi:probable F420-dependent oxidoreductase
MPVQFGIEIVTLGELSDPAVVVDLARAAEAAGWDGVFVWDHLAYVWGVPAADPWVALSAAAAVTSRIRLGTWVTPLPRHRPHVLAQTLASLDLLSGGRTIFGAGLGGVAPEYAAFGEPADRKHHAAVVDEGLELLNALWSGERVDHHGRHFTAEGVTLRPLPVQRPRIPIWIGGDSPPALRRAARWDGWAAVGADEHDRMVKSPEDVAAGLAAIGAHRRSEAPFELALDGCSTADDRDLVRAYRDAGVTWWLERVGTRRGPLPELLARVAAGPARP